MDGACACATIMEDKKRMEKKKKKDHTHQNNPKTMKRREEGKHCHDCTCPVNK